MFDEKMPLQEWDLDEAQDEINNTSVPIVRMLAINIKRFRQLRVVRHIAVEMLIMAVCILSL